MADFQKKLLDIRDLTVQFDTDSGVVHAVNHLNMQLEEGKALGFVGETGAGKTTTALAVLQLIQSPPGEITSGEIWFKGQNVREMTEAELRNMRGREIAMIFQDPMTSLNPIMTVEEQIMEMISLHSDLKGSEVRERALEMMRLVGIRPERAKDYPHQFSGGMRQRVGIAIALACKPSLLIADEPTTALDVSIQAQILSLIKDLQKDFGSSIMLISHDLGVIATMAQKVAVMYAGSIIEYGTVRQIFEHPLHPYTQGLLGAIPRLDQAQEYLEVIPGALPNLLHLPEGCKFRARCSRATKRCALARPAAVEAEEGHEVACYEYR